MKKSKKAAVVGVGAAALLVLGAGAAMAATSGYMSVSTDGAYVSNAYYNFKYSGCNFAPSQYDGYVKGTFVVTTATDHLNATVDGYGYTKLIQANSKGNYGFNNCIVARGDVLYHTSITLQACREHWYGDNCHATTKNY